MTRSYIVWFTFFTLLWWWNCTQLKEISNTVAELKQQIVQMQIRDFPPIEDEPISDPDYYDENSTKIENVQVETYNPVLPIEKVKEETFEGLDDFKSLGITEE